MRILLAEDDTLFRRFVLRALDSFGHIVEAAADGAELLRLAGISDKIDLILSDINMPKCNGIVACRLLKTALPRTRFLLMTGNRKSASAAARAGFERVLLKPFDVEQLRTQVDA